MHITSRQEQLSHSVVYAIASKAGCAISLRNVDDDSVDLTLCSKLLGRRPSVDVQLKCTGQDVLNEHEIRFFLEKRNYDDLRLEDVLVPRILIVVIVPSDIEEWIEQSEEQLVIRKCGYWASLRGFPPMANTSGVTVSLPRTNIFTPLALTNIMQKIHNQEDL